ncbi:myosin-IIIb-like isoform X2 [Ornithodoros turicata]|uniref:myosin-IIIb-like isoform X2 n=1 Tax=Ornithodoros turicata TaxID=34597 RepID=UPI003138845B
MALRLPRPESAEWLRRRARSPQRQACPQWPALCRSPCMDRMSDAESRSSEKLSLMAEPCKFRVKKPSSPNPPRIDPKLKLYYDGISQHVDLLSLPAPGERFSLQRVVGEGTYGEVYAARDTYTDRMVAVKIMENIADNVEEMDEEHRVLRDLCAHPNIPTYFGIFFQPAATCREDDQVWFVMELCTGGSVTDLVQGLRRCGERLPERAIAYILRETMEALRFLHEHRCMHRDVKGHNILLTEHGHVKLVDFGVSSHLEETMGRRNTSVGTPYWMAPEVVACERQLDYAYDIRCDVWSLGITGIELAEGEPPLADVHPMRALFQIPRNPPPTLRQPSEWSDGFNAFLALCLIKDYEKRPLMAQLMAHPFIEQVPRDPEEIRKELVRIIKAQQKLGYGRRIPEVTTKHGQLRTDRKSRPQRILVDDLSALETLTEDVIVDQIYQRYIQGQIYTYIGDILLAVNPFRQLPIYATQDSMRYRNRAKLDNPPHIFAVADSAYHSMMHQKKNQCVVISGESGAGKTESANFLLKQLVALGKASSRQLEDKILQVNPIMEAFGNAKTGMNDNSSRFGKFLDLSFTEIGKITGAKLSVYLLEQSRVIWQAPQERNFHIFYYLYDGLADAGKLKSYHLDGCERARHRYLQGAPASRDAVSVNVSRFTNIKKGFQLLGFRVGDIDTICCILAAILNLGELQIRSLETKFHSDACSVANNEKIPVVGQLLGLKGDDLLEALTSSSIVMRGEVIHRRNSAQEAESTRDAMAKALYARLFDWIVNQINQHLSFGRVAMGIPLSVAVLDIFGFEDLQLNSFEQLCINIANEQIQFFFNQHVFAWEQQEYLREGLTITPVTFGDNRPLLDMFLGRPLGLLALLDEESHFPSATDHTLIEKFHANIKSKFYVRPKSNALQFTIRHHAGKVSYNARNFVDKNRNYLPPEIVQLLRQSKLAIVQTLFQCPLTKTGQLYSPSQYACQNGKALQTTATSFRYSLMDLLQKMSVGLPHFVRCLKPNEHRLPGVVAKEKLLCQLRYTGVIETVHVRQQGFSHRFSFAEFIKRYGFLAFSANERMAANRENCHSLLVKLKMDDYAIGKTKVFLKYYHVEYLSRLHEQSMRKIIIAQAAVRRWLAKRQVQKRRFAIALITQRCHMKKKKREAAKKQSNKQLTEGNGPAWKCILDLCQKVHPRPANRSRHPRKSQSHVNMTQVIMTCHHVPEPKTMQAISEEPLPAPPVPRARRQLKKEGPQRPPQKPLSNQELCCHELERRKRSKQKLATESERAKEKITVVPARNEPTGTNASRIANGPTTVAQVESWLRKTSFRESPRRDEAEDPNQGPYQFKKILRPSPTSPQPPSERDGTPRYDFRKLLRKTEHAPTATLRRCKGLPS